MQGHSCKPWLTGRDLRVTSTCAALLLPACNMTTGLPAPLLHNLYPVSGGGRIGSLTQRAPLRTARDVMVNSSCQNIKCNCWLDDMQNRCVRCFVIFLSLHTIDSFFFCILKQSLTLKGQHHFFSDCLWPLELKSTFRIVTYPSCFCLSLQLGDIWLASQLLRLHVY